jgi:hypothetical protein
MTTSSTIPRSSGNCNGGVTTLATNRGCCGSNAAAQSGSCDQCDTQGFVRPRFFAGQLLTEDDLQALGNYMVAKNRLHNRHFFGDGVVCGLEVTCHPCGKGSFPAHGSSTSTPWCVTFGCGNSEDTTAVPPARLPPQLPTRRAKASSHASIIRRVSR